MNQKPGSHLVNLRSHIRLQKFFATFVPECDSSSILHLTKLLVHNFVSALLSRRSQFSLYGAILTVPHVSLVQLPSLTFHKLEFSRD